MAGYYYYLLARLFATTAHCSCCADNPLLIVQLGMLLYQAHIIQDTGGGAVTLVEFTGERMLLTSELLFYPHGGRGATPPR